MLMNHPVRALTAIFAVVCLGACEAAKSANPTAPSVAGPIPGVSITAPKPLEPGAGVTLTASADPFTLLIENAGTTGQRALWLELQMAADAGFQQIVHQADRIEPGPNGRTSYRLPEPLGAGFTYYWRTRAADGANIGPYSAVSSFSVVLPVVIDPPVALEPSGNLTTNKPTFKVRNGAISGTSGVVYRFQISTTADMSPAMALVTVTPGSNGDTTMSLGELPYNTTFYWRVYGTDGATQSANSQTLSFKTSAPPAPPPPTPGPTPPAANNGPVGGRRTISINEAAQIIKSVHDAEGWNLGASSSREQRIAFFLRAAATVHYGHGRFNNKGPDSNWCVKDAGGGRPISDDVLVRCDSRDAYDLISGAGGNGYSWHIDAIGILPGNQNVFAPPRSALP
jgi:hypothetical protein